MSRCAPAAQVTSLACSLFVTMAEEGWTEGPIAESVARRCLDPIFTTADTPDTLVLGCTHFPLLASAMRAVLPPHVAIVDSAATTAAAVCEELGRAAPAQSAGPQCATGPQNAAGRDGICKPLFLEVRLDGGYSG